MKLVYARSETFAATPKRHPFFMKVKVGAKKDGTLMALDFDVTADGGAYKSFSNSVTQRGLIHSQGPYRFPNAHVYGKAVYTNTAFKGAMRGFGVPQVAFAIESILDELASELKMDPLALRMKNGFVKGDTTICGQVLDHTIGFQECLETIKPHYERALREAKANTTNEIKRGVGLGGVWFGPGRSAPDQSEAWAELLPDDTFRFGSERQTWAKEQIPCSGRLPHRQWDSHWKRFVFVRRIRKSPRTETFPLEAGRPTYLEKQSRWP